MKKQISKKQRIINHLERGSSITSLMAWRLYGHARLAVVINRLKNKGWSIDKKMISENGSRFAEYKLEP